MKAMAHNDKACSKLYLTGIFYFAFSTLEETAFEQVMTLIHQIHLKQNCGTVIGSCNDGGELSLLANILPRGLFNVLVNKDAKTFCQVFSGSLDSPEGKFQIYSHSIQYILARNTY